MLTVWLAGIQFPVDEVVGYFEDKVEGPCAYIWYRRARGYWKKTWVPLGCLDIKV